MIQTIQMLKDKGLAHPDPWLPDNCIYQIIGGSVSYGVSSDFSDIDILGVVIPPKSIIFPFSSNLVYTYDKNPDVFEQYIEHGIYDPSDMGGKGREYDFTIYSLPKIFNLWAGGNPNALEMLFVSNEHIIQMTQIGKMIRDYRENFLSKECYKHFMAYLSSQIHKAKTKFKGADKIRALLDKYGEVTWANINSKGFNNAEKSLAEEYLKSKRLKKFIDENQAYDYKFMGNTVRLAYECETILNERTIDLKRFSQHVKSIREGNHSMEDVMQWLDEKEKALIATFQKSTIPERTDRDEIRKMLLHCLEMHYGSLDKMIEKTTISDVVLKKIIQVIEEHKAW